MLRLALFALVVALACAAPQKWMTLTKAMPADKTDTSLRFEPHDVIDEFEKLWEQFKNDHDKDYGSKDEESMRKDIFKTNVKKIQMHNYLHDKGVKTYRLGVNEFADMEHGEFVSVMNGYKMNVMGATNRTMSRATYLSPLAPVATPDEVDWRNEGYVTPVKNQGQCGSCWSFSATGALEGQHFRQSGTLTSLSEQNLVDCSAVWGNNGCNGGLMDNAFQYIKDNGGIDTEEAYPYTAQEGTCHYNAGDSGATDVGFTDLPEGNEDKLKEALATIGPISIAIDASHPSFQLYKTGVYVEPECSSEMLDHGVLVVGYGTQDGQDYWLVKNSWGETWGQEGYIYMARNKDNQCGVASKASYPNV